MSAHPYPFNLCYCSICRKTAGGGGFAINLGGDAASLTVEGEEHIRVYHARMGTDSKGQPIVSEGVSEGERRFCGLCGSALWVWDPGVEPCVAEHDNRFAGYPDESLADWHQRLGLKS